MHAARTVPDALQYCERQAFRVRMAAVAPLLCHFESGRMCPEWCMVLLEVAEDFSLKW